MKKLMALAIALLLSGSASAVSFTWQSGNTTTLRVQFGSGTYVAATAYLVNLNSGWSISEYTIGNTVLDTTTAGTTGRFSKAYAASIENGEAAPGDVFGVYLTYTTKDDSTGENVTWVNIMNYTYTLPSGADDTTTINAQNFGTSANYNVLDRGSALTAGGGWTSAAPIPEPGTAAMALLGLGLLIRRRRKA